LIGNTKHPPKRIRGSQPDANDIDGIEIVRRSKMTTMENLPEVVSREEWLAARKQLLRKEMGTSIPATPAAPVALPPQTRSRAT
jgi:hypothetical protein